MAALRDWATREVVFVKNSGPIPECRRGRHWRLALAFAAIWLAALLWSLTPGTGHAQDGAADPPGVYTVVPGDTMAAIANRFDVPIDTLVELNNIIDPALIQIGQQILLPGADAILLLGVGETASIYAEPGETLGMLATRTGQDIDLLAAINSITVTQRLFPGQSVIIPAENAPSTALRFGAVTALDYPPELPQGHTGYIRLRTDRPISPTVTWAGTALPLAARNNTSTDLEALLPAGALLETDAYSLTVNYTTRRGAPLTRTWTVEVVDSGYGFQQIYVPDDRLDTLDPATSADENALVNAVWANATPAPRLPVTFARPIDPAHTTTSPFGTRRTYNDGLLNGYHSGQDFGAPAGITVTAPITGVVALSETLDVRGNALILDHGRGVLTGYWHLSEILVAPGQPVSLGQAIGLVGNTGRSTGAHLHWEMRVNGVAVDPLQFLDQPLWPTE